MEIVQVGDPVLREVAKPVELEEITTENIQTIIGRMSRALAAQDDGVAIAAPQIGESLRIFVVSHKVFAELFQEATDQDIDPDDFSDKVFINPKVIEVSDETVELNEGCLSVRWQYGKVNRVKSATVQAYDQAGEQFTMQGSGLLAQIFQHETDHLDGVLFIDKAKEVREIEPDEKNI